jgi:branched-subunit amino acid ABC-type transport system permease component
MLVAITRELVIQDVIDAIAFGSLYALFALGIALIFGVMRLVNFAHGELIMAGAYTLVLIGLPSPALVPLAVLIVVCLALAMERFAFRPLRGASPATLLVASFALSFLLQSAAALKWGSLPRTTDFASGLSSSFTVGSVVIAKLDIVITAATLALLIALNLFLNRTTVGTQMRAAAEDFRMARSVGIRANTVIATAFALSGLLAAVAATLLVIQTGTITPTVGVNPVLVAFIATIVGGLGSLSGAVLGGYVIGALTVALQASLPLELRPYRDAFVFATVLLLLIGRPQGLLPPRWVVVRDAPRAAPLRRTFARSRRARVAQAQTQGGERSAPAFAREELWPLVVLMAGTCLAGLLAWTLGPDSLDRVTVLAVIDLILVIGLYTFVGVSGVFSFGHAAFMAIGAYAGAIFAMPPKTKEFILPDLPRFLADVHLSALPATLAAGGVAAVVALVLAVPLVRLSGLTAGLATFAVLVIVNVVARNWQQLTHGTAGISGIPTSTTIWTALAWALAAMIVAWAFQRSRFGLRLRASREDESAAHAIGIRVARERGIAFVLSAFFVGAGGALYGMFIGSFTPDAFFLNITFLITAMLIVGGMTSLAGAVVGTIVISTLAELLRRAEEGTNLGLFRLSAHPGLRDVGLALVMLAILILRPSGLTGGRELRWRPIVALRGKK